MALLATCLELTALATRVSSSHWQRSCTRWESQPQLPVQVTHLLCRGAFPVLHARPAHMLIVLGFSILPVQNEGLGVTM